ncbi:MAG: response regulator transcription factor [Deltaproteobacteria bacterium]|nr:response regulator transcription factor [Deltaproteobacteria bacterium]
MLVIDGDGSRRIALATALGGEAHDVELAASLTTGLHIARTSQPDLVIVDAAVRDSDGVGACARLRAESATAGAIVLVIGASLDEADRVAAFEDGCDDYVVRPFSTRELMLRVRALLRRTPRKRPPADVVSVGPMTIDRHARKVAVSGERVPLTRKEFDLLLRLVDARGRVLTRNLLVAELWPEDATSMRVVDTTLKRIRKKLPWLSQKIRTVRGVGYELDDSGNE